jgi:hypothetical protein
MAPLPDVVKWLAEDITWTTDLGNAFLAQQEGCYGCCPADAEKGAG